MVYCKNYSNIEKNVFFKLFKITVNKAELRALHISDTKNDTEQGSIILIFGGREVQTICELQNNVYRKALFVPDFYQTGLDTRSMARSLMIEEIRGRGGWARPKARALLDYAGHRPGYGKCVRKLI